METMNTYTSTKKVRGVEVVADAHRKHPNTEIQLPKRGTKHSAGYDFYLPETITIAPRESVLIWSDVKAYMQEDEVLKMYIRSSIGTKLGLVLKNGTGIIDSDYYSNEDNDGNMGICLRNTSHSQSVTLKKGERVAQGIFVKYLVADNDNADATREGGFGSTVID